MATTIQIDEKTLKKLQSLKLRLKARSYDEVIQELFSKKENIPQSLFGSIPNLPSFSDDDRLDLHQDEE